MAGKDRSFHFAQALLPEGWAREVRIEVQAGAILSVSPNMGAQPDDERVAIALPGLSNLHSHAFQRAMAGLAEVRGPDADSFWTWREIMYRFVDRLTPDGLRIIAAQAYVEMLECGFTRVGEFHYLHQAPDGRPFDDIAEMSGAIVDAAEISGIALTHLPVFYAHAGFGGMPPNPGQRRFIQTLDQFSTLLEGARALVSRLPDTEVGIAPHSLRAVTPDELAALVEMAGQHPIHIHIAEQQKEVADCIGWSGARPVEWLLDHATLDRRWCLVHATHMTDGEAARLGASGAVAGLCPITEANLGDGLFNAAPFLAAGGAYGVGSDSNVMIDATEELRLLEYGQRLTARGRNMLALGPGGSTGQALYDSALEGGARALGVESGLRPGAPADFVSLDAHHPAIGGRSGERILDGLIFASGRTAIDGVWRRGEQLVSGGRHIRRASVAGRYRALLEAILP
jgi:formiminoglutamate deiminase